MVFEIWYPYRLERSGMRQVWSLRLLVLGSVKMRTAAVLFRRVATNGSWFEPLAPKSPDAVVYAVRSTQYPYCYASTRQYTRCCCWLTLNSKYAPSRLGAMLRALEVVVRRATAVQVLHNGAWV